MCPGPFLRDSRINHTFVRGKMNSESGGGGLYRINILICPRSKASRPISFHSDLPTTEIMLTVKHEEQRTNRSCILMYYKYIALYYIVCIANILQYLQT
jgi:hypothetical protein